MLCKYLQYQKKIFFILFVFIISFKALTNEQDHISLEFKLKDYALLEFYKSESKKNMLILPEYKKSRSIFVNYNNNKIVSRISLDGIGVEHFWNERLVNNTLKISIDKNYSIMNMQNFRIIDPEHLFNQTPFVFNFLSKHFNMPIRKYDLGYALTNVDSSNKPVLKIFEEDIDKNFLDRNFLREGILFKLDVNNKFVLEKFSDLLTGKIKENIFKDIYQENYKKYKLKQTNEYDDARQIRYAADLFKNYINGKIKPQEAFDYEYMSKLFVMHVIWGDAHSIQTHNIKFYFDPVSKKLSVIPTDPFDPRKFNNMQLPFRYKNTELLFHLNEIDEEFVWHYNLLKDEKFQKLIAKEILNLNINELKGYVDTYSKNGIIDNELENKLNILNENLDVINVFKNTFLNDLGFSLEKAQKENYNKILSKYFIFDHKNQIIKLKKNKINKIDKKLIIDSSFKDYKLVLNPQNHIIFNNKGNLTVYSDVEILGTDTSKIIIESQTDNSYINFFGKNNKIFHAEFINFNISNRDKDFFNTSPLTFYKSNVEISNSIFKNSLAEDLVNFLYSIVDIEDSFFKNSTSDMIDFDVANVKMKNITLENCGNDCIDFSNSVGSLININTINSKDKAISIGEKSNVTISKSKFKNCENMCVAVKDSSVLNLDESILDGSKFGITGYIKKNIFEKPVIKITNVQIQNSQNPILIENKDFIKQELIFYSPVIENNIYKKIYDE